MAQSGSESPEPTWTLGPLSIKRTTDVLAFVAFILSVVGLLAQLRDYLRGPDVVFFAPEQVTLGSSRAFKVDFQDDFLVATAIMSYVNYAPVGFNAVVAREYIRFQIGDMKYQYIGHETVSTSSELGVLNVKKKDDSGPFAVGAGSAVSHEVLFEPHPVKCSAYDPECAGSLSKISWDDFKLATNKNPTFTVTLLADVYSKTTISAQCTVTLGHYDLAAFAKEDRKWSAPNCDEEKEIGFWRKLLNVNNLASPGNASLD
jgi:hypothetical protein